MKQMSGKTVLSRAVETIVFCRHDESAIKLKNLNVEELTTKKSSKVGSASAPWCAPATTVPSFYMTPNIYMFYRF